VSIPVLRAVLTGPTQPIHPSAFLLAAGQHRQE
jgi:hypothetical protein